MNNNQGMFDTLGDTLGSYNPFGKSPSVATPAVPVAPAPVAAPTPILPAVEKPLGGFFDMFKNNRLVSGTKEFLESNSIVAKVAFIILVVILFVFLLRLGTGFINWLYAPSSSPKVVSGVVDGASNMRIRQDPRKNGSVPLLRSVNENDGIEFTYSVWINIKDLDTSGQKYRHIFHKGNPNFQGKSSDEEGISLYNNAPGLYIHPNRNDLVIVMNTFNNVTERITISDIPLNKWINVIVRVEGQNVDVYVNGTIVVRHVLGGVPRQNYDDLYVGYNGGFNGRISDLWYHNYALNTSEILNIVRAGPDLTANAQDNPSPPYFSLRWYYNNGN